jgi:RHS repeat-associated protein
MTARHSLGIRLAWIVLAGLSLALSTSIAEGATLKFHPASGVDPVIGHYVVTLDSSVTDAGSAAGALARAYGGQLELYASADARIFAITMLAPRARTLSADPRVREVVEVAQPDGRETPPVAPRQASLTSPHLVPHQLSSSGTYAYDGSGNIKGIGTDSSFVYDTEDRLVDATVQGNEQRYEYDIYGNRTNAYRVGQAVACLGNTTCEAPVTMSETPSTTNHLAGVTYDEAGNVTQGYDATYVYDGTGMMTKASVGTDVRNFVYTADDERIAVKQGLSWTWSVRDQSGKVLREFTSSETSTPFALSAHAWSKDYVWRDGQLLASTSIPAGYSSPVTYHYHLNHLGTPRLITRDNGIVVSNHNYYPFGSEMDLTPQESPTEAMKFTGHERDIVAGSNHSVDYMHARYYNGNLGRFLATDPSRVGVALQNPQSWNRYAYAQNNPVRYVDTNGRWPTATHAAIINGAFLGLHDAQRGVMRAASARVDSPFRGGQTADSAFQHGMRAWWQSAATARAAADNFIADNNRTAASLAKQGGGITNAALDAFGTGLHTVTDRTSPTHKGEQVWTGGGEPGVTSALGPLGFLIGAAADLYRAREHENGEAHITIAQYHEAVDAARTDYLQTFGLAAFKEATGGCEQVKGCKYDDKIFQTLQKEGN